MQYASIEDETTTDNGNFEMLIEYRTEDFKDFSGICKDLCDFRQQVRVINRKHQDLNMSVGICEKDVATLEEIKMFLRGEEHAEWSKKVDELIEMYKKVSEFEDKKKELQTLEEQKAISDTITSEFKIQPNQAGTCVLCYEKQIEVFLDPCGHVCCAECWKKADRGARTPCPCCRTTVTKKKMYLI